MDSDIWLPLATLIGGWGLAQVTEVLRDRRASGRDRQARQADLQRTTLLALQDTLLELFSLTGPAQGAFFGYHRNHPNESARKQAVARLVETHQQFKDADARARLLISRIEDDEVRQSATLFLDAAGIVLKLSMNTEVAKLEPIPEAYGQAIDRIGEILRQRY
jgi:hypothetical protein